jgi:hypothetical protein
MTNEQILGLIMGGIIWFAITGLIYIVQSENKKISFNYKTNYYYWKSLNWIGIVFFTICLKILLLPAYIIWLIYKLFTFGRKD